MQVSFYLHSVGLKSYLYVNVHTDEGRYRASIGTINPDNYPDKIPKQLKNLQDRIRMRIENLILSRKLDSELVTRVDIQNVIKIERKGKRIANSYVLGHLLTDYYNLAEKTRLGDANSKEAILNSSGKKYTLSSCLTIRGIGNIVVNMPVASKDVNQLTTNDIQGIKSQLILLCMSQNTIHTYMALWYLLLSD